MKIFLACIFFLLACPATASFDGNLSSRLSGRIVIDVNNHGEAWYVYPGDFHRYSLGSPEEAYILMRNLSLGISNDNFSKISSSTPDRFNGMILIKPDDHGKAYYVNPIDKTFTYLANATEAFKLMQTGSLGISNSDLKTIPVGEIILDNLNQEIDRKWQYLGFWGMINQSKAPVLLEAKSNSPIAGYLYLDDTVKILNIKKADGHVWYRIDGGKYLGAYIDSVFVKTIAQPTGDRNVIVPNNIQSDDYWVDVNLSKKVLTLYKYNQVLMSTYVSVGISETPTITGSYYVWYKLKTTRMKGSPPIAFHAYDLPDVPWVMFYAGSYSIHGTYWHDNFGTKMSAGCTNATISDAKYIFDLTIPVMSEANSIRSSKDNPGLLIINHY